MRRAAEQVVKMEVEINNIVNRYDARPENTGLVVGVLKGQQVSSFGFGRVRHKEAELPSGDTLYEIGSVSKVFTSTLFSIMVAEGLFNLDDAVCDLVPSLAKLPPEITLMRLATHTSGLPKMPTNILGFMLRDRENPYSNYSNKDLLTYLSGYKEKGSGNFPKAIAYSNLGAALLGYILSEKLGSSYEEAVVRKICDPLKMANTKINLSPGQKKRLAGAHKANGKPSSNWDLNAFAGAGALKSTVNDMLTFLAANTGAQKTALAGPLQAAHEIQPGEFPQKTSASKRLATLFRKGNDATFTAQSIALGWHVSGLSSGGKEVYWHHGATGGYRSFVGFQKEGQFGVVVLANRSPSLADGLANSTSADSIGFRVLNYLSSSVA